MDDIELMFETALTDTIMYRTYNGNGELSSILINGIKNSIIITEDYIKEQILQLSRTRISPMCEKVLTAYRDGKLVLLYSKGDVVPEMMPFFATKTHDGIKVYIFVNRYGTISKNTLNSEEKYLNISMKDLYALLQGAYISYICSTNPVKITKSLSLMKTSSYIFTYMFLRILNKEYSISMDQTLYNRVIYSISKYYLKVVWGCDNSDIINAYAKANIKNMMIDPNDIELVSKLFDDANITDLKSLIDFLKTLSPRMNSINLRYIIQCYIVSYKAPALFGIEALQYFLFTIQSTLVGSYIVNAGLILDVIKSAPGMNVFYSELTKLTI